MKEIMNKGNDRDHLTEANILETPLGKFTQEEIVIAINQEGILTLEVCAKMMSASGEVLH